MQHDLSQPASPAARGWLRLPRPRRWGLRTLSAVALAGLATVALAEGLSRDALGHVVALCLLSSETVGGGFPCRSVSAPQAGRAGAVTLRSPNLPTEVLVAAADPVAGIESPALRRPESAALWADAWAARREVEAALGRALPRTAVGLAVNALGGRTQDRFHIHVDCVEPEAEAALRRAAPALDAQWRPFPGTLEGKTFWVRRIEGDDLAGVNVTDLVATGLPKAAARMSWVSVAVLPLDTGFAILANLRNTAAEGLLDHACTGR